MKLKKGIRFWKSNQSDKILKQNKKVLPSRVRVGKQAWVMMRIKRLKYLTVKNETNVDLSALA